jgi:DNA-binding SARP family transcriptional activator
MTTRDEIFGTFWPELSVRDATNVFHVTKRKISELLGFDLTVYGSGFYRVSPDVELAYDVVKFGEYAQNSAVEEDEAAIAMLERGIYLYRGQFLNDVDAKWVQNRREDLSDTHVEALFNLARLYEQRGDRDRALGLYSRALAVQPYREDIARAAMQIHKDMGHTERALEMYLNLVTNLKRVLNIDPDPQTTALAQQLRPKSGKSRR